MTTHAFTTNGKEVLRDNDHIALARTEEIAMALAMMLDGLVEFDSPYMQDADNLFVTETLWP